jgi:hypothetical protein
VSRRSVGGERHRPRAFRGQSFGQQRRVRAQPRARVDVDEAGQQEEPVAPERLDRRRRRRATRGVARALDPRDAARIPGRVVPQNQPFLPTW